MCVIVILIKDIVRAAHFEMFSNWIIIQIIRLFLRPVTLVPGLTKGAGVLPDGPLNATVGGTVMFTTTLAPEQLTSIHWTFEGNAITSSVENSTGPGYEGRITLFLATGSLELRSLTLNDSGEYRVVIQQQTELVEGSTRLEVYGEQMFHMLHLFWCWMEEINNTVDKDFELYQLLIIVEITDFNFTAGKPLKASPRLGIPIW